MIVAGDPSRKPVVRFCVGRQLEAYECRGKHTVGAVQNYGDMDGLEACQDLPNRVSWLCLKQ